MTIDPSSHNGIPPTSRTDPPPDNSDDKVSESVSLTGEERSELMWLRAENTLLRVERDILLRVASGYAKDMDTLLKPPTPRSFPR
ncbi:hypothetical protein [Allokutzneria oryzae]|uniref:Transposase n=1 Tax=Allokutzneria oryzae TaxID=1378989 RepID=A0ABV6A3T4_9PSEU